MTRTALYARISLDRLGDSLAVQRQEAEGRKLAAAKGWTVTEVYADNSISASTGKKRPAFERLLDDLESGAVQALIAWHPDRLARRPDDLERLIAAVERHKVKVATVQAGEYDLGSPSGRAVARTVVAWARAEVEHKGERQKAAALQRAQLGRPAGGPRAFGYEPDGITVRANEAKLVRDAYKTLLAGGSLRGIASRWNAAGMVTGHGNGWTGTKVRRTLQSPRYAGMRALKGEVVGTAVWKPLVSEEVWRAVLALLADPARRTTPETARRYLLSGLALCFCGAHVDTGRTQHGARTYKCSVHRHLSRGAEVLDDYVDAVVRERLSRAADLASLITPEGDPAALQALRDEADLVRARLEEAAALFAEDGITAAQLAVTTRKLRDRLGGLEGQMAASTRGNALGPYVGAKDPVGRWQRAELDERRAVLRDMFATITLASPGRGARTFDPATVVLEWRTA